MRYVCLIVNLIPYFLPADWLADESYDSTFEQVNVDTADDLLTGGVMANPRSAVFPHIAGGFNDLNIEFTIPRNKTSADRQAYLAMRSIAKQVNKLTAFSWYPDWLKLSSYIGVATVSLVATVKTVGFSYDQETGEETFTVTLSELAWSNYGKASRSQALSVETVTKTPPGAGA